MDKELKATVIRQHILRSIKTHPKDLTNHIAKVFSITRQTVYNHLRYLESKGFISTTGYGSAKRYYLGKKRNQSLVYNLNSRLAEDKIWQYDFSYLFDGVSDNILDICYYGFTEMVNNIIDHSEGEEASISMTYDNNYISFWIYDDGIGIFRKIRDFYKLDDDHQALFELSKGKLTTDPKNHTGEGIFFTSRIFSEFQIYSRGLIFTHMVNATSDFLTETQKLNAKKGTFIKMSINRKSSNNIQSLFDEYAEPGEYQFTKTSLDLRLALHKDEKLTSRSQAKRVLNRVDKFTTVALDFDGIDSIGQAFADEIFRVFARKNPKIALVPINANEQVSNMIKRAQGRE